MRTTLRLDPDVAEKAKSLAARLKMPFRHVINEALRLGLDRMNSRPAAKPYRTVGHRMGLRPGFDLDNIQEVIEKIEGEDAR